jgi:hypothetical protein
MREDENELMFYGKGLEIRFMDTLRLLSCDTSVLSTMLAPFLP